MTTVFSSQDIFEGTDFERMYRAIKYSQRGNVVFLADAARIAVLYKVRNNDEFCYGLFKSR